MNFWLLKSEPSAWSWADQTATDVEPWSGVRNHQAASYLKAMKKGDRAFFYHSVEEKRIVGIVEVTAEAHPDPTDPSGKFVQVLVKAVAPLPAPVTLAAIKAEPKLAHLPLLKQSRLSVMPIDPEAWKTILKMGGR